MNGGRAPHSLKVIDPNGVSIASWTRGSSGSVCSGTNLMTCTVQQSSVNFFLDGFYTITAKNLVAGYVEKTATDYFKVTVFKDVTAAISPGRLIAVQNNFANLFVKKVLLNCVLNFLYILLLNKKNRT